MKEPHKLFQGHKSGTDQYRAACTCGWIFDGKRQDVSRAVYLHSADARRREAASRAAAPVKPEEG